MTYSRTRAQQREPQPHPLPLHSETLRDCLRLLATPNRLSRSVLRARTAGDFRSARRRVISDAVALTSGFVPRNIIMTTLFQGEAESEGVRYTWAISEGSLGRFTAVVSIHSASVAAVVETRPESSVEAKRLCDLLVPELRERLLRTRPNT
jgi:hypothetical protein